MVGIDDEGNTITPDELASPSHGNKGKNIGNIYNNPELSFKENNQGKYMMVSYMGSSIIEADKQIRALAETGIHTDDSESGDVTWKLDSLPTDEEVLARISSFVSRGMTTMRDEEGKRIEAEALTTDNYAVLWCQVKYQSANNDGWNINGVLSTKAKLVEAIISEMNEVPAAAEPEVTEPEVVETEVTEPEVVETEVTEPEVVETENTEPEVVETENTEPEVVETESAEPAPAAAPAAPAPAAPVRNDSAPAALSGIAAENTALSAESDSAEIVTLSAARPSVDTVEINDGALPMAAPVENASLSGWALINLICALLSLYILLPLLGLKAKFERASELHGRKNGKLSEAERSYLRRFRLGMAAELLTAIAAIALFVLTQDLGTRMLLTDGYTPLMAALAAACAAVDFAARRERGAETVEA